MVRGEWIIFPKEMRCKNWRNGIEIVFALNEKKIPEGKVRLPPALAKQFPFAIDRFLYVYKMWRQAASLLKKVYLKKTQHTPAAIQAGDVVF
jgi:hypothetical protein